MPVDVVIEGGTVVTPTGILETGIAVDEGKIVAVGLPANLPKAERVIRAEGRLVVPGVVDGHTHIFDPDYSYREDFRTGSQASAAGGVTTFIDMPLREAVVPPYLAEKIRIGEAESLVDFSLHSGMITQDKVGKIQEAAGYGVLSFKAYTCEPFFVDDATLMEIMEAVAGVNGVLNVHAENNRTVSRLTERAKSEGKKDPTAPTRARPRAAEAEAISRVIRLSAQVGVHVHIVHMTTREGAASVAEAKGSGLNVTAETCPQYLHFTEKDVERLGPYLKMYPPLRTGKDIAALWEGLRDGSVDIVASDHAPGTREEKEVGWSDIWEAWGGVPGVETMLPLMLSEGVSKGRITIERLCQVLSTSPAKIFGLYPRKGAVAIGSDADLVLVDPKLEKKVKGDDLHSKCGWTPYEGVIFKGWPVLTMVRGEVVMEDGQVIGKPGHGRFVSQTLKPTREEA